MSTILYGRELYQAIFRGEILDQLPVQGLSIWAETRERWIQEGLPPNQDHNQVLGLVRAGMMGLPLDLGYLPRFPLKIHHQDESYVTLTDELGITKRMLRADFDRSGGLSQNAGMMSTMSQWLDFPVKELNSWKRIFEERLQPDLTGRLPEDWNNRKIIYAERADTHWVCFNCFPFFGLFGFMRELMGLEGLVFMMKDHPKTIHTIVDDLTTFWLKVFDQVLTDVRLDQITFFEDMCSTHAPLISPAMFREFLAPGYRKVVGGLKEMGVTHFILDSDGYLAPLINEMMQCGITGTHPCEVNSRMEADVLCKEFPGFWFNGGIDKRALTKTPDVIEEELRRRFAVARRMGRYTPTLDHGAPPDISWENIQYYAQRYREYCLNPDLV